MEIDVYLEEADVGKYRKTAVLWYKLKCRHVVTDSSAPLYIVSLHQFHRPIIHLFRQLSHHCLSTVYDSEIHASLCITRIQTKLGTVKSFLLNEGTSKWRKLLDIYHSETKGNLRFCLGYGKWCYIMLSICLSLPSLPCSSLRYFSWCKRKIENKNLSPHIHIECLFIVWDDTADNIISCMCWNILFILMINI